MTSHSQERGFTLLELMIAMSLMALLATLLLSLLRTTTTQIDRLEDEVALEQALQQTLAQLRQDIRAIYWRNRDLRTGLTGQLRSVQGRRMDRLEYVTLRLAWNGTGPGDMRPVAVRYDINQDRLQQTLTELANGHTQNTPLPEVLISPIQELRFQFHNGEQWQDSWDTQMQQRLPVAISVRLVAQRPNGPPHILQTVLVPMRSSTLNVAG